MLSVSIPSIAIGMTPRITASGIMCGSHGPFSFSQRATVQYQTNIGSIDLATGSGNPAAPQTPAAQPASGAQPVSGAPSQEQPQAGRQPVVQEPQQPVIAEFTQIQSTRDETKGLSGITFDLFWSNVETVAGIVVKKAELLDADQANALYNWAHEENRRTREYESEYEDDLPDFNGVAVEIRDGGPQARGASHGVLFSTTFPTSNNYVHKTIQVTQAIGEKLSERNGLYCLLGFAYQQGQQSQAKWFPRSRGMTRDAVRQAVADSRFLNMRGTGIVQIPIARDGEWANPVFRGYSFELRDYSRGLWPKAALHVIAPDLTTAFTSDIIDHPLEIASHGSEGTPHYTADNRIGFIISKPPRSLPEFYPEMDLDDKLVLTLIDLQCERSENPAECATNSEAQAAAASEPAEEPQAQRQQPTAAERRQPAVPTVSCTVENTASGLAWTLLGVPHNADSTVEFQSRPRSGSGPQSAVRSELVEMNVDGSRLQFAQNGRMRLQPSRDYFTEFMPAIDGASRISCQMTGRGVGQVQQARSQAVAEQFVSRPGRLNELAGGSCSTTIIREDFYRDMARNFREAFQNNVQCRSFNWFEVVEDGVSRFSGSRGNINAWANRRSDTEFPSDAVLYACNQNPDRPNARCCCAEVNIESLEFTDDETGSAIRRCLIVFDYENSINALQGNAPPNFFRCINRETRGLQTCQAECPRLTDDVRERTSCLSICRRAFNVRESSS